MEIVWILVGTKTPENLGAAARAIKAMGFAHLRLVNPCDFSDGPARWMAMHSHDILDAAQVHATLESALADCDVCVGATAKLRHHRHTALTPPELQRNLADKAGSVARVAIVFGPEDTGLTNEHLAGCDILTSIPLAAPQPSLNLAQAVMLYTYTLSTLEPLARYGVENDVTTYRAVIQQLESVATDFGLHHDPRIMQWLRERAPLLAGRDLRMLFNVLENLRAYRDTIPVDKHLPDHEHSPSHEKS